MSTWTNFDGLDIEFGLTRANKSDSGKNTTVQHKTLVHRITGSELGDTDTAAARHSDAYIPKGAVITRATLYVKTAFAGATAELDIGLKQKDGTNTDAIGIQDAIAVTALDAIGDVIVCAGTYIADGNLTGKRLTANQYVMATYDTAAFTAGEAELVVEYLLIEDL